VAPGGFFFGHIHSGALCCRDGLRVIGYGHIVHAGIFLHGVGHGHASPARGEIQLFALPLKLVGAKYLLCGAGKQFLKQVHHGVKIAVGLVELNGGEFGVVLGVHALVAENSAYLVHPLNAAHDEPLQVKLRGYAQVHVHIQGVVVGDKGSGGGAAGNGVQNRCFNFHITAPVQIAADIAYEFRADFKIPARLVGHYKIHIALAVL